ncbi:MAG: hypothetical protein V1853_04605, partial [bacterium]
MLRKFIFILIFSSLALTPFNITLAQGLNADNYNSTPDDANRITGLCANINTLISQRTSRFSARTSKVTRAQSQRAAQLAENKSRNHAQMQTQREIWDENRLDRYFQLRNLVHNDEQSAAIEIFIEKIDQAVAVRRAAVDQAINNYQNSLQNLIDQRNTTVQSAISRYQSSISVALDAANFDCANGNAVSEVRKSLADTLETAKSALTASRQS